MIDFNRAELVSAGIFAVVGIVSIIVGIKMLRGGKMSPNFSSKTKPIAFRVSNEVHAVLERRAKKQGKKIGEYTKGLVSYDTLRKR